MSNSIKTLSVALSILIMGALALPPGARAEERGMKGLGLSGYIDAVGAFSRTSADYAGGTIAPGLFAGTAGLNTGGLTGTGSPTDETDFTFAATELKLHFDQDFDDKAFAMASLSFAAATGGTGASSTGQFDFDLQQAAVGLLFGNTHVILGRFYAPIGIESVDANARATATLGNVFAGLEPFFLTGLMIHYVPEEGVGGFVFAANNIQDSNDEGGGAGLNTNAKALGVGVTYASGDLSGTLQYNVDFSNSSSTTKAFEDASQLVDLSVLLDNDEMLAGLDVIYRRENLSTVNADLFGIELLVGAKMDDLTVGLRGEIVNIEDENNILDPAIASGLGGNSLAPGGTFNAGDGQVYAFTPFVTYAVTEGVFARLEYRADITNSNAPGVDPTNTQTVIAQLNASFQ